jgi:hypothetical protein
MSMIKRLFGGARPSEPEASAPAEPPGSDKTSDSRTFQVDNAQAGTRRELVRVMTRDTLRASGIPDGWIETQLLLELGRGGQTFVHLRLVVRQWDVRLLKYTVAFQARLLDRIHGFDPTSRDWLLTVSWQYQVGSTCPFPDMPDPSVWLEPPQHFGVPSPDARPAPAPAPAPAAPVAAAVAAATGGPITSVDLPLELEEPDEVSEDLAQLFAIRDAHLLGAGSR